MTPTTPTGPPVMVTTGDTWGWRVADLSTYPQSDGWALHYRLRGPGTADITPTFQTSGDDAEHWLAEVAASASAAIAAGRYRLYGYVAGSGDYANRIEPVSDTVVEVLPDPRTAQPGDFQTHAERTLAVIEAALEGRLTSDIESYQIAGRAVNKIPVRDLTRLRGQYASLVARERGRPIRRHLMAFPNV